MIDRQLKEYGIDVRYETELKSIEGNDELGVQRVVTNHDEEIQCEFVGITVGVKPNIDFISGSGIDINIGILVDRFLETSIPGIYAIGDCAEIRSPDEGRRAIEPVWYTGSIMGRTVAANICGDQTEYHPGTWYNSAKFFDIEYQVYGNIPPIVPDHLETIYWEHPDGKKSIRLNWEKDTGIIIGFNLMGIRYRQEVCEHWIREQAHIHQVLEQLSLANFDPEFERRYESRVVDTYNRKFNQNVSLKKKKSFSISA